jgi:hypothetical protein
MKMKLRLILFAALLNSAGAADFLAYSTAGHAKAQGVGISIAHPATWLAKDNPKPGIVREFRDPVTGGRDAMIIVVPSSQPRKGTPKEFRKSFEHEGAQERIMPGARHRRKEFVEGLEYPCVALDYDLDVPQLAPAVVQVRNYILLVGGKMVQVQFYGVAPPSEDLRAARTEMMEHVIRSIKKA